MRFKLITLVVIDTDYTGSCKYNYHTITATTAPNIFFAVVLLHSALCFNQ